MSIVKYRLKEVAADFGVAPKEIGEIISKFFEKPKSNTQILTEEELNVVFDYMTQKNQISSLEVVFAAKPAAPKAEEKPAEPKAEEKKPAAQQPAKPQQSGKPQPRQDAPKAEQPAKPQEPERKRERRVVDTSAVQVNAARFDDRGENLDNAAAAYEKLIAKIATLKNEGDIDTTAFENLKGRFAKALEGDLNTSVAVTAVYDVLKAKTNDATKLALIADFDQVLCLNLISAAQALAKKQAEEEAANADPEIDALVAARTEAKKAKNWAEADRIRDELKARGIEIIDTPQGAKWRKV